jgi:predicted transcriptional regulator of viral defense system
MKFDALVVRAAELPLLDTPTLQALSGGGPALSVQIARWVRTGRLVRLRRGAYLLPPHLRRGEPPLERLGNLLRRPSYVSLERALSLHGLIPEAVPWITSVTPGHPGVLDTAVGVFSYRHVRAGWFSHYRELSVGAQSALVATPEKALLDLVHFSPGEWTEARIAALRLQNVERLDLEALEQIAREAGPRVQRAAVRIRAHVEAELAAEVTL